ncbi:MAG: hypothetical protein LBN01_00320 [Endomicrobium sp.]|nr:hypothetical protein [Endomicrobium sp.]
MDTKGLSEDRHRGFVIAEHINGADQPVFLTAMAHAGWNPISRSFSMSVISTETVE